MNAQIELDNLKCNGCATTIKKELKLMKGVSDVGVDHDTAVVTVVYAETVALSAIKDRLASLGYPEIDSLQGMSKIAANAKSYVSCAVGKLS